MNDWERQHRQAQQYKDAYIGFTDDTSPNFIGNDLTLEEYMLGNFNLDQIQEEQSL